MKIKKVHLEYGRRARAGNSLPVRTIYKVRVRRFECFQKHNVKPSRRTHHYTSFHGGKCDENWDKLSGNIEKYSRDESLRVRRQLH